jgi:hypothetical protein
MDEIAADKVDTELHFLTSITQNKSSLDIFFTSAGGKEGI